MKRFFDKIEKMENGCWNWTAALRGKSGYGSFKLNGKIQNAHRVSWILHYGSIPEGLFVCHKCDNRRCVNPEHLFLGTNSDNMKDAYQKNKLKVPIGVRFETGHTPYNKRLTNEQAKIVKNNLAIRTQTIKELAIKLNLPYCLLRDINSGRVYKNI